MDTAGDSLPSSFDYISWSNGTMPKPHQTADNPVDALSRDLLNFYDELTAVHASIAFVMQALASSTESGEPANNRSAMGATFCVEWLNDRTIELEQALKKIRLHARSLARAPD
jgi:hypothetical protein